MIQFSKKALTGLLSIALLATSCTKNLERFPQNDITAANLYTTEAGYKQVLGKVYASLALTGNSGPAGAGDVARIDEGTSDFVRLFFCLQELSTDEAVVAWNDPGIQDLHNMNWSSSNPIVDGIYSRCFYAITISNEFIRESADDKVAARGIANAANIKQMRNEARYIRSFAYWVLMDLFGNPGFVDENTPIGAGIRPSQIQRAALFNFIEKELKELENTLPAQRTNEYGRVDKAAVWALLSRMYLNAQVYTGTPKFTESITYSKKVIDGGYALLADYRNLMLADNNVGNTEAIWTLNYDGLKTQNYGGTTFLVNASVGGDMDRTVSGLTGWGGLRATKNLPLLFPDFNGTADKRGQFFQQALEIDNIADFKNGFAVTKYRNRTKAGGFGVDPSRTFSDIDFPVFRLAEMHLNYIEAVLRGGTGGDNATALAYANAIRARAYGNTSGSIAANALTLDYLQDERSRELHWEGLRRTDLIRFGKFTDGNYLWPFKGGVKSGTSVGSHRRVFPIPAAELGSNPNIIQNPNY
jgi:starch-binding outer membrane protein, SusD/RagB family